VPEGCAHNGHLYYLLFDDQSHRAVVQTFLRRAGTDAVFHYVPLHSSPAGRKYTRTAGPLPVTERTADRLLRLPLSATMSDGDVQLVTNTIAEALVAAGVR
jgi:dTDP-4-amino-4,6-dideoxygalactose transaminase